MIEKNHLIIIEAVDRLGTLTEASASLCLTQSALSHSIKKLENQLGVALWEKDGRNLRLTQSGRYLLSVAKRVLPQLDDAQIALQQFSRGLKGTLRIGMECHPCYQWLLSVISPYLEAWPEVDVDVKQKFQFGGLGALFGYEIDVLVTPDPLFKKGLVYLPVFDYEHVLVVSRDHPLANKTTVIAEELSDEVLITYPVEPERLDIFSQFLAPAKTSVRKHKTIEATEIMLQMIESQRGVGALPRWLVEQYATQMRIAPLRLGGKGLFKSIHLGLREDDLETSYIQSFVDIARGSSRSSGN